MPERHDDPSVGTIRLRVTTVHRTAQQAAGSAPAAAPIVYLDGSAGGSSVAAAVYYAGWSADRSLKALLARRDLVAIDLRGTGGSLPRLACEGLAARPLPAGEEGRAEFPADEVMRCRRDLVGSGATLASYGTEAAARDVIAVVAALGLESYDLVAASYGARVALEVVRRRPPGLRSLVLDSPLTPTLDLWAEEGGAFAGALERAFARCAGVPSCAEARAALDELVARLDAEPVMVSTHESAVTLTGRTFLRAVWMTLYDGDASGLLPRRLLEAKAGNLGYFAAVLGAPRGSGSVGVNLSVACAEQWGPDTAATIESRAAGLPPHFARALTGRFFAHACPLWAVPPAAAALRAPLEGPALPALVLSGELDPVVPPAALAALVGAAAGPLVGARLHSFPEQGHATLRNRCVAELAARFLDDPAAPASPTSCAVAAAD